MSYRQEPGQPPTPPPIEPEPARGDVVVVPRKQRPALWSTPLGIFLGVLLLTLITFAASLVLLTRVGAVAAPDNEVTITIAPTRAATAAPATVRVAAGPGLAERLDSGGYRVSFTWTLEGAREGDTALLRFSVGSRVVSEQRGTLDPNVFSASTGRFTVTTAQECSADGWTAEIVTIRSVVPVGEATSRAAGVTCR